LDIVLKLYSTTTNWGDTLDHIIYGDILDYEIVDNSNYLIDTAWFKINNTNNKWSDQIDVDVWDGSETTQVWRAFTRADQLINSGVVTRVSKESGHIITEGEGMTSILKRRAISLHDIPNSNNSGSNISGTYILTENSDTDIGSEKMGIVPRYFGTTYGTLNYSTYVDATNTTNTREWYLDGLSVWDVCIEIARGSYGTNGKPFDVYLFETYDGSTFTKEFYFREKESQTSAKTILQSDLHLPSFYFSQHAPFNFNKVTAYGAINPRYFYPKYTSNGEDEITSGLDPWVETSENSTMHITQWGPAKNKSAIKLDRGVNVDDKALGYYDNATYRWDTRYNSLKFSVKAMHDKAGDAIQGPLYFYVFLGVKDKFGNASDTTYHLTGTPAALYFKQSIMAYHNTTYNFRRAPWSEYEIPLPKANDSNGWTNATKNFSNSNLTYNDWSQIYRVGFILSDNETNDYITQLSVDDVIFIGNVSYSGSSIDGTPTYLREYVYRDEGLRSNTACISMAANLLRSFKVKQYQAKCVFTGVKRDYSLKAGDTCELVIPSKNIIIKSGETPTKLPIQRIEYTPNKQTLILGRQYSLQEIINNTTRMMKLRGRNL